MTVGYCTTTAHYMTLGYCHRGGGVKKNCWYQRTAFFSGGTPGGATMGQVCFTAISSDRAGGGGYEKNSREKFVQTPKPEIS